LLKLFKEDILLKRFQKRVMNGQEAYGEKDTRCGGRSKLMRATEENVHTRAPGNFDFDNQPTHNQTNDCANRETKNKHGGILALKRHWGGEMLN